MLLFWKLIDKTQISKPLEPTSIKLWILLPHSIRFGVFLSKIVQYDLWLFQLFLAFFNSLYQELSGYVSHISLVLHIYPQEVQEHRLFCSFSWKIRFLLLAHVGKKVKNFTGAHMCTQTQLIINNFSPIIIYNNSFYCFL